MPSETPTALVFVTKDELKAYAAANGIALVTPGQIMAGARGWTFGLGPKGWVLQDRRL